MGIQAGSVVTVHHERIKAPFKSVIHSISDNNIYLKMTDGFKKNNILENDKLSFNNKFKNEIHIYDCRVVSLKPDKGIVNVEIQNIRTKNEERVAERFPVALYADIYELEHPEDIKKLAAVRDMSATGLKIFTNEEFGKDVKLGLDLNLNDKTVPLKAKIMRMHDKKSYYEYGLEILKEDKEALSIVKQYIDDLKNEFNNIIMNLKKSKGLL
jgi:hypothetical protein